MGKDSGVVDQSMNMLSWIGNGLLGLGAWVLMYTGLPIEPTLILGALMAIDIFSGIGRAHSLNEQITSRRMNSGIASKLLLLLIPLAVALAAKGLDQDWSYLVSFCVSAMILSELYSFISNIYAIKTGDDLPEFDVIKILGKHIRAALERLMDTRDK